MNYPGNVNIFKKYPGPAPGPQLTDGGWQLFITALLHPSHNMIRPSNTVREIIRSHTQHFESHVSGSQYYALVWLKWKNQFCQDDPDMRLTLVRSNCLIQADHRKIAMTQNSIKIFYQVNCIHWVFTKHKYASYYYSYLWYTCHSISIVFVVWCNCAV